MKVKWEGGKKIGVFVLFLGWVVVARSKFPLTVLVVGGRRYMGSLLGITTLYFVGKSE